MSKPLGLLAVLAIAVTPVVFSGAANADSCWYHNGSLMRLVAQGNQRKFLYEEPKPSLRSSGVRSGTLLFNGRNDGGWYSGTARVFSRHCVGDPQMYPVEGPVSDGQRKVTMEGRREGQRYCEPTGEYKFDKLVFTYAFQC